MDEQLNSYKNKHQAKYAERENVRSFITQTIDNHTSNVQNAEKLDQMEGALKSFEEAFKNFPTPPMPFQPMNLQNKGMDFLTKVNTNSSVKVNFNDTKDVELSRNIQGLVKNILEKLGIPAGNMGIEYHMDTSNDEEVARKLNETINAPSRQRTRLQQPASPNPQPTPQPSASARRGRPPNRSRTVPPPPPPVVSPVAPSPSGIEELADELIQSNQQVQVKPKRGRKPRVPSPLAEPVNNASN